MTEDKRGTGEEDKPAQPRKGFWTGAGAGFNIGTAVALVVAAVLVGILVPAFWKAMESGRRTKCFNCECQIILGMIQYASEYNDCYPSALTDENEPAQRRFARLLALNYMNAPKAFHCPSARYDRDPDLNALGGKAFTDCSVQKLADVFFGDDCCSYGMDPRVKHTMGASRAVIADKPDHHYWGTAVSSPGAGQPGSNSENHGGYGQIVAYNDGHLKWAQTCEDDSGIDPNIYGFNNPEVNVDDDSNIDFGEKPAKEGGK